MGRRIILAKTADPRMVTIQRGGRLSDSDHRLLGLWAAGCAANVLHHFELALPEDMRCRRAVELARRWGRGELTMKQVRFESEAGRAAREVSGAAKFAAQAAAQAVVVAHVPGHNLGAAAYAIRAARAAAPDKGRVTAGRRECAWQRRQLPSHLRALVLADEESRNSLCWFAFD